MKFIIQAIKDTLLSYTPARSQLEAMMKYDFKVGAPRTNLMQLCFSNLASWPLVFLLAVIAFDPFKATWSLVGTLGYESAVVLFLLNGQMIPMLAVFGGFFVLEWLFRKEYLFIAIIFYLLNRGELHIHLATVGILAVYLSRICYLLWFSVDCESETKVIWKASGMLQLVAWFVSGVLILNGLDYMQIHHLFQEATELNRYNFLLTAILIYHIFSHLFLCMWGHFYFQAEREPANLPVYYSTAAWILRFNMSYYLQSLLQKRIATQLESHLEHQQQLAELKASSPGLAQLPVGAVLETEIRYLKEANLRLTRI